MLWKKNDAKKTTILVKGMHCPSCEILLIDVLRELKGVKSAKVSYADGKAIIEHDVTIASEKALCRAIEAEGYKAEVSQ